MTILLKDTENIVLDAIQDYLDRNRVFEMDKVIPYIRNTIRTSSIDLNDNGIKFILESLIEKKYIIQGSKMTKIRVLKNENRSDIYYLIKNNPGIISNHIKKELKLSNYVLSWHLEILCKFGCIKKVRIDKHDVFFHFRIEESFYIVLYLLSNKTIKNLISCIDNLNEDGVTKTSVSNKVGINYRTVSKYFNALVDAGLLYKKTISKQNLFYLSKNYKKFIKRFYK